MAELKKMGIVEFRWWLIGYLTAATERCGEDCGVGADLPGFIEHMIDKAIVNERERDKDG